MTHTPGPWTIDDTGPHEFEEGHVELNIWGPDGAYFGAIAAIRNDYSGDMDSNARLIAQAPTLHAENQKLKAEIEIQDEADVVFTRLFNTSQERIRELMAINAELLEALKILVEDYDAERMNEGSIGYAERSIAKAEGR
ncbi:hypothetical protein LCGC14_1745830 [marine sediment metagenome]|uniref:Uncharacterized protein n=1 Tax=marine sediment metagenome TaxID=412755 RepID=A0A0F9JKL8_9ZZZZ